MIDVADMTKLSMSTVPPARADKVVLRVKVPAICREFPAPTVRGVVASKEPTRTHPLGSEVPAAMAEVHSETFVPLTTLATVAGPVASTPPEVTVMGRLIPVLENAVVVNSRKVELEDPTIALRVSPLIPRTDEAGIKLVPMTSILSPPPTARAVSGLAEVEAAAIEVNVGVAGVSYVYVHPAVIPQGTATGTEVKVRTTGWAPAADPAGTKMTTLPSAGKLSMVPAVPPTVTERVVNASAALTPVTSRVAFPPPVRGPEAGSPAVMTGTTGSDCVAVTVLTVTTKSTEVIEVRMDVVAEPAMVIEVAVTVRSPGAIAFVARVTVALSKFVPVTTTSAVPPMRRTLFPSPASTPVMAGPAKVTAPVPVSVVMAAEKKETVTSAAPAVVMVPGRLQVRMFAVLTAQLVNV